MLHAMGENMTDEMVKYVVFFANNFPVKDIFSLVSHELLEKGF